MTDPWRLGPVSGSARRHVQNHRVKQLQDAELTAALPPGPVDDPYDVPKRKCLEMELLRLAKPEPPRIPEGAVEFLFHKGPGFGGEKRGSDFAAMCRRSIPPRVAKPGTTGCFRRWAPARSTPFQSPTSRSRRTGRGPSEWMEAEPNVHADAIKARGATVSAGAIDKQATIRDPDFTIMRDCDVAKILFHGAR